MNEDLTNYFTIQNNVTELEAKSKELKDRIKELDVDVAKLKKKLLSEISQKSRYKRLYEKAISKKVITRGDKALVMIKELKGTDSRVNISKIIAKKYFLSMGGIKKIWDKHNKESQKLEHN